MPAAVQRPASQKSNSSQNNHDQDIDTDPEDIEDVVGVESDQDSDAEEDLPLELDDGRNANKVKFIEIYLFNKMSFNCIFYNSIFRKTKWKWNI